MVCEPDLITIREAMYFMEHCYLVRLIYNTNKLLFNIEISAMVSIFIPEPYRLLLNKQSFNLYQLLTCYFNFKQQNNRLFICNCEPKCIRTDYDVSIMSSIFSKHAAGHLYAMYSPPNNLAKGRHQKFR